MTTPHAAWLENEYAAFEKALGECTPDNCRRHPMVRKMLSEDYPLDQFLLTLMRGLFDIPFMIMANINMVGHDGHYAHATGATARMIHYAYKLLDGDYEPLHITEIGGGIGMFYIILRALGYAGDYWIMDRPLVQDFQRKYLERMAAETGLKLDLTQPHTYDFVCSFYALGEFDDELKASYVENVVKKARHGLVVWNPHSGASAEVPWSCRVEDESPLTYPGNKLLTW